MKQKGSVLVYLLIIVIAVAGMGAAYYFGTQKSDKKATVTPFPTPILTSSPTPTQIPQASPTAQQSNIPVGWSTYQNTQYGFEISYPSNYQALDDSENLYGWPNGVVLFYKGGQAYDIAVEVWDSETEYQSKYGTNNAQVTAYSVGNKFVTLMDNTQDAENASVIATFNIPNP
jgi:hypothetical protein